jgi:hypothetical protein
VPRTFGQLAVQKERHCSFKQSQQVWKIERIVKKTRFARTELIDRTAISNNASRLHLPFLLVYECGHTRFINFREALSPVTLAGIQDTQQSTKVRPGLGS